MGTYLGESSPKQAMCLPIGMPSSLPLLYTDWENNPTDMEQWTVIGAGTWAIVNGILQINSTHTATVELLSRLSFINNTLVTRCYSEQVGAFLNQQLFGFNEPLHVNLVVYIRDTLVNSRAGVSVSVACVIDDTAFHENKVDWISSTLSTMYQDGVLIASNPNNAPLIQINATLRTVNINVIMYIDWVGVWRNVRPN